MNKKTTATPLTLELNGHDEQQDVNYYGQTMQQQIMLPNPCVYMVWRTDNFSMGVTDNEERRPYLRFSVDGTKFKGYVTIIYGWLDLYNIEFTDMDGNLKGESSNLYYNQLQDVINLFVSE